jgi:hypothetical protein
MIAPPSEISALDLHCPQCGYNLRGIESELCPECGLAIDRAAFAESQLPWSHRKRIGYVRAYFRTLAMGLLDSKKLAMEVARPVSFRDAQKFRYITVVLAWVPLAVMAIWARGFFLPRIPVPVSPGSTLIPEGFAIFYPWMTGALTIGVVPLALGVFLIFLSGVASYYFHPKSVPLPLQNRAVALSYYACGPILLLPLIPGLILATSWMTSEFDNPHGPVFATIAICATLSAAMPLIALAWAWLTTLRLHRRIVHASGGGSVLLALTLPLAWLVCAIFAFGAVVWVIGFVELVVRSFG